MVEYDAITIDGTYEHVVESLKIVRAHIDDAGGSYIHTNGAVWLRNAIIDKIKKED